MNYISQNYYTNEKLYLLRQSRTARVSVMELVALRFRPKRQHTKSNTDERVIVRFQSQFFPINNSSDIPTILLLNNLVTFIIWIGI